MKMEEISKALTGMEELEKITQTMKTKDDIVEYFGELKNTIDAFIDVVEKTDVSESPTMTEKVIEVSEAFTDVINYNFAQYGKFLTMVSTLAGVAKESNIDLEKDIIQKNKKGE